jgi:P27 family predicted phage terminase small subunit
MAKRGPKSIPTSMLRLRGSFRRDRHGHRLTGDKFAQKRPACPQRLIRRQKTPDGEFVRKIAKRTWDRLAPELHAAGLLVDSYRESLEMLVDSYGRFVLCCQKLDEQGHTSTSSKGTTTKSPWARLRAEFFDQVAKGTSCFGLTPADLAGVRAVEKPLLNDGKAKFFRPPGNGA